MQTIRTTRQRFQPDSSGNDGEQIDLVAAGISGAIVNIAVMPEHGDSSTSGMPQIRGWKATDEWVDIPTGGLSLFLELPVNTLARMPYFRGVGGPVQLAFMLIVENRS